MWWHLQLPTWDVPVLPAVLQPWRQTGNHCLHDTTTTVTDIAEGRLTTKVQQPRSAAASSAAAAPDEDVAVGNGMYKGLTLY